MKLEHVEWPPLSNNDMYLMYMHRVQKDKALMSPTSQRRLHHLIAEDSELQDFEERANFANPWYTGPIIRFYLPVFSPVPNKLLKIWELAER